MGAGVALTRSLLEPLGRLLVALVTSEADAVVKPCVVLAPSRPLLRRLLIEREDVVVVFVPTEPKLFERHSNPPIAKLAPTNQAKKHIE